MGRLTEEMKRIVEEQRLAFVATVDADGTPNLSPKGTIAVLDDDHLMFADLASPQTVENLQRNATVELNVVDPVTRTGYRFKGRGVVLGKGERFEQRPFSQEAFESLSGAASVGVHPVVVPGRES